MNYIILKLKNLLKLILSEHKIKFPFHFYPHPVFPEIRLRGQRWEFRGKDAWLILGRPGVTEETGGSTVARQLPQPSALYCVSSLYSLSRNLSLSLSPCVSIYSYIC